jgi:hypothetical protein
MMQLTKVKVQGEKLHTHGVSHGDSVYTKLSSSIDVLLGNNIKCVLTKITMSIYFLQFRLIINTNRCVADTCIHNHNNVRIKTI